MKAKLKSVHHFRTQDKEPRITSGLSLQEQSISYTDKNICILRLG